jgi:hypothetical protein
MLKFAEDNVIWREEQTGMSEEPVSSDDQGTEPDQGYGETSESESSSTSSREEMGHCEQNDSEFGQSRSLVNSSGDVVDSIDPESRPSLESNPTMQSTLVLDPLSGAHLKAVKKLAGYFRLRWTEQGSGKCRRLMLHAKSGPQAPAEINGAENLISKYKKIERGVTTKRLPTARCTPQVSGTQVDSFRRFLSHGYECGVNLFLRMHTQRVLSSGLAAGTFWRLGGLNHWLRFADAGCYGGPDLGARCRYLSWSGIQAACN